MVNPPDHPLQQASFPIADTSTGKPTQPFAQYLADLDKTVRALTSLANDQATQIAFLQKQLKVK